MRKVVRRERGAKKKWILILPWCPYKQLVRMRSLFHLSNVKKGHLKECHLGMCISRSTPLLLPRHFQLPREFFFLKVWRFLFFRCCSLMKICVFLSIFPCKNFLSFLHFSLFSSVGIFCRNKYSLFHYNPFLSLSLSLYQKDQLLRKRILFGEEDSLPSSRCS